MPAFRYLLPALCLLCGHIFAAPVTTPPQSQLVVAVASAAKQLNPMLAADAASARLLQLTHPALMVYDTRFQPAPNAASCQQTSPLTITCNLTPGLVDTNNQPYTAPIAAGWLEAIRTNPKSPLNGLLKDVANILATTPTQFILTLRNPSLAVLPALAQIPLANPQTMAGLGPYKFAKQDALGTVTLSTHKQGLPNPLILMPVQDATTRLLKLQKHEVDVLANDLPPELIPYAEKQGFTVTVTPGTSYAYLLPNWRDDQLSQPAVRKAIALGLNRPLLRSTILAGTATTATTILPPTHPAAWQAPEEPYDWRTASLLLEETAGMLADADGFRTELTLTHSTDATTQRVAQAIQQQLARIGIALQLRPLEWASFFDAVRNGKTQLAMLAWTGEQTPTFYHAIFNSKQTPAFGGFNRGAVKDPILDDLTDQLMRTTNPATQTSLTIQIQQRQAQVLPYIPLYRRSHTLVMGQGVSGCTMPPSGALTGLLTCHKK